jgi:ArsR family transcriptional regulator, arsenate/arsenite/antimonite-responsive transcriptional repressor
MKNALEPLKALADGNRLRIVAALMEKEELCACQFIQLLQIAGATVSRHMELLIRAKLVRSRKDGRWVHYRLDPDFPGPILNWLRIQLDTDPVIKSDRKALQQIIRCS